MLLAQENFFPEQLSTDQFAQNVLYTVGILACFMVLVGLILVDVGGVRRVNVLDNAIQKLIGFFIGVVGYAVVGFAIWMWQYYVAFGYPEPYWTAIKDWWLGGALTSEHAQRVDPAYWFGVSNTQLFIFYLGCFAGLLNVFLHLSVTERIKPRAYFAMCVPVSVVVWPVLVWLLWGSTSPITKLGFHDFFGVAVFYVFAGGFCLTLARRVGPRIGMFAPDPRLPTGEARPYNLGHTTVGLALILMALPPIIASAGFWFPEAGYFGVNFSETSLAIIIVNLGLAMSAGMLMGGVIAYKTKKVIYALLGPLAGYFVAASSMDIYEPWQMFVVALGGPVVAYFVYEYSHKRGIDEHKLIPLGLGAGTYGLVMVGLVKWGTETSGFLGIEEGPYAFQGKEMNVGWQLMGWAIGLAAAIVTAEALCWICKRTIGLRLSEEEELKGGDLVFWETVHDPPVAVSADGGVAAPAGVGAGHGSSRPPEPGLAP
jgi:ammonia channel protein AmtB